MESPAAHLPGRSIESNLAELFVRAAAANPNRMALAMAGSRGVGDIQEMTFRELDRASDAYAHGLRRSGLLAGDRVLLLMKPSTAWIALVLGLLKSGIVVVMVDPGMNRASLLGCIESAAPAAMVGTPIAHVLAALGRRAFAGLRMRWLAGWPWAPGAIERLARADGAAFSVAPVGPDATAAIVFTTGSTGDPKGVVYTHGNYFAQLDLLRRRFSIEERELALPGYLPFAILCLCMGNACAIATYHPARPASVDPKLVMELVRRYRPSYGLGSPAFWSRLAQHGARTGERLDGMRLLMLFGAEVHESILRGLREILPAGGELHTPYGSTEAQPITTISDRELLDPGLAGRRSELGVCVGTPLDGVEVELVAITDGPVGEGDRGARLGPGAVGEVVVRGPMVTGSYFRKPEQDRLQKIGRGRAAWHRMGDCGSFDGDGRLWLAGRKAQRIETADGLLFPLPVEARTNRHPAVRRSALVGVGPRGSQRAVLIAELFDSKLPAADRARAAAEIGELARNTGSARSIRDVLFHPCLPVDYRHNAKIQRDVLARWAQDRLR